MNDKDIRDAMEIMKPIAYQYSDEFDKRQESLKVLVNLAKTYLEVKGLPEKIDLTSYAMSQENYVLGFNEARELCILAYAKRELKLKEKLDGFREVIKKHCLLIQKEETK